MKTKKSRAGGDLACVHFDETAFIADLLSGNDMARVWYSRGASHHQDVQSVHIHDMRHIVDRLRAHTIHILTEYRHWAVRHERLQGALALRYSAYEGVLIRQDVRQQWILYRRAMHELVGLEALAA